MAVGLVTVGRNLGIWALGEGPETQEQKPGQGEQSRGRKLGLPDLCVCSVTGLSVQICVCSVTGLSVVTDSFPPSALVLVSGVHGARCPAEALPPGHVSETQAAAYRPGGELPTAPAGHPELLQH